MAKKNEEDLLEDLDLEDEDTKRVIEYATRTLMRGIRNVMGETRYNKLETEIDEAGQDELNFIPRDNWTLAQWSKAYGSGKVDFAELPDKVKDRMKAGKTA